MICEWKKRTRTEGEAGPMMNRKPSQLPTQFIDQTAAQPPLSMDSHVGYLFVTIDQVRRDAINVRLGELPLLLDDIRCKYGQTPPTFPPGEEYSQFLLPSPRMSSGSDGGISGGGASPTVADDGGGVGIIRKSLKKFGKNLNALTKAPEAPPAPAKSGIRNVSARSGLLLLSTKSNSTVSEGGSSSGGLLASKLLLSSSPPDEEKKAAWSKGEKQPKESIPSIENRETEKLVGLYGVEKSEQQTDLSTTSIAQEQQRPRLNLAPRTVPLVNGSAEKKVITDSTKVNDKNVVNEKLPVETSSDPSPPTEASVQPKIKTDSEVKETGNESSKEEDVKEYMSRLAKERTEKLRLEEETRMLAQKERAAMRLRELEERRMEERKKKLQIVNQERIEASVLVLEQLGKSTKEASEPTAQGPKLDTQTVEKKTVEKKKVERNLWTPDRTFSSLVGGSKMVAVALENINEDTPLVQDHPPTPPLVNNLEQTSPNSKTNDPPPPAVQMIQLSNLDVMNRGDKKCEGKGGPRMLFDAKTGKMKAVREDINAVRKEIKAAKKLKEKVPKVLVKPEEASVDAATEGPMRGKQGKGNNRKDETQPKQKRGKKSSDKAQPDQRKKTHKNKDGNYVNVDGCEPDNGNGAHRVPGGRAKNPKALHKLLQQQEAKKTESHLGANRIKATDKYSYRNDPGVLRPSIQSSFEAQQQKILEDAWATLIENDEPKVEVPPASKTGHDNYAAALAMSGLNFTMDSMIVPQTKKTGQEEPMNLVTSLWGANASSATNTTYGDLSALTGWTPIPFGETETSGWTDTIAVPGTTGIKSSNSKLHLWGSGALDESGMGK